MNKSLLFLLVLLTAFADTFAQNLSNKGKEFWVGYGHNQLFTSAANSQEMVLYLSAEQAATVTVSIPGTTFTPVTLNIPANTVNSSILLPKSGTADCRLLTEG